MDEVDDFDKTLVWAIEEEKLRSTRGQGIASFYLVIISLIIFVICFLFLFYSNRGKKLNAIDMLNDPDNLFENFSNEEGEQEEGEEGQGDLGQGREEIPIIDLSEEVPDAA